MQLFLWVTVLSGLCAAQFRGPSDPRRFRYYTPPTPGAGPCDIATGPDGENIWYQDYQTNLVGVLFTKNTKVVKISEFPMPRPESYRRSELADARCLMRLGQDGFIYGSTQDPDTLMKVTAKGPKLGHIEIIRAFPNLPFSAFYDFNDGWAGPTGFFSSQTNLDTITFLPYGSKKVASYRGPTPGGGPLGMRIASDGALWFTYFFDNQIGRFNYTASSFTVYPLAKPGGSLPGNMRTQTQGRYLWANAYGAAGLIRVDVKNPGKFKYISGAPSNPVQNAGDPFGNVWVSSYTDNVLAYYSPSKDEWTNIVLPNSTPTKESNTTQTLPVHYGPLNSMWFTNLKTGQIGQYILNNRA